MLFGHLSALFGRVAGYVNPKLRLSRPSPSKRRPTLTGPQRQSDRMGNIGPARCGCCPTYWSRQKKPTNFIGVSKYDYVPNLDLLATPFMDGERTDWGDRRCGTLLSSQVRRAVERPVEISGYRVLIVARFGHIAKLGSSKLPGKASGRSVAGPLNG